MQQPSSAPLPPPTFGEPTPLGLICLSIGCASLVPFAFGMMPSDPAKVPMYFETMAMFCLMFGAGGQILAGLMSLANKNTLGGTLFTAFAFNWVMNWWGLSQAAEGRAVDGTVLIAVDVCFILIFLPLTYAFGFYSKLLFFFLVDIDLLYVLRILRHFTAPGGDAWKLLGTGVGVTTVALAGIALYISFVLLVNPAAGRAVFPTSAGPMFKPRAA
ncbi:GPR1/FUN34/YaaH family transporter [Myxococcota bacterium]|nr:GPR1/FUN34/YaaH family transporter [Myxococcota bacterium]